MFSLTKFTHNDKMETKINNRKSMVKKALSKRKEIILISAGVVLFLLIKVEFKKNNNN